MKNILITGSKRGLGKKISEFLSEDPQIKLFLHSRNGNHDTEEFLNVDFSMNTSEFLNTLRTLPKIDVFIDNASPYSDCFLEDESMEETENIFQSLSNTVSLYKHLFKSGLSQFIQINSIASDNEFTGEKGGTSYIAYKSALLGLGLDLIAQTKSQSVIIRPGPITYSQPTKKGETSYLKIIEAISKAIYREEHLKNWLGNSLTRNERLEDTKNYEVSLKQEHSGPKTLDLY